MPRASTNLLVNGAGRRAAPVGSFFASCCGADISFSPVFTRSVDHWRFSLHTDIRFSDELRPLVDLAPQKNGEHLRFTHHVVIAGARELFPHVARAERAHCLRVYAADELARNACGRIKAIP